MRTVIFAHIKRCCKVGVTRERVFVLMILGAALAITTMYPGGAQPKQQAGPVGIQASVADQCRHMGPLLSPYERYVAFKDCVGMFH